MGLGCDHIARGEPFLVVSKEEAVPGGGMCRATCYYVWDGVARTEADGSPLCEGLIDRIEVVNTSTTTSMYSTLPRKASGDKWVEIPPNTNRTIVRNGPNPNLRSLGLEFYSQFAGMGLFPTTVAPGIAKI